MDLFFGTGNAGKLRELRRLVAGLPLRVVSPADLERALPEVEEDQDTFEGNAAKKAVAYAQLADMPALADDSGLCVDALGGAPGVRSARWSEDDELSSPACALPSVAERELGADLARAARDEANNAKLLRMLAGVRPEDRGAEYRAVLVIAMPDGSIAASVEGTCRGRIGEAPRGTGGFGYDPLFIPEAELVRAPALARTMAELSPAEKDALSHRGEAFRQLRPVLARLGH
jgi:XTP/dITP diphosphohydrolase